MSYQVLARKYRSQTFPDLIGQEHITQTLINAISSQRMPHALLFCGTRGVGKTSSARILAKTLLCPNVIDFKPCNKCSTCIDITASSHMDVIEIDGASNNGVDAIRELRETVGYTPANGKYKIYIIDEVHMLSTSAFNALLKTLEEPPAHVIFILATTEVQKIPATILSRCQRFDFRKISTRKIQEHLESICRKENLEFEPDALWQLARLADGSARDALSLLEQIVNFTNGKLHLKSVVQTLGLTDQNVLRSILQNTIHGKTDGVLNNLNKLFDNGQDPIVFCESFLESLRHLLIVKVASSPSDFMDLADEEVSALKEVAQDILEEDLHLLFDMALKGSLDILKSQNPKIVLEMLLLRMARAPRIRNLADFLKDVPDRRPTENTTISQERTALEERKPPTSNQTFQKTISNWSDFVKEVKKHNPILGTQLDHAALSSITNTTAFLEVPDKFFYEQLKEISQAQKIKAYFKQLWNKEVDLDIQLKKEAETPKFIEQKNQLAKDLEIREKIESHPLVEKIKKSFDSKVSDIQDLT